MTMEQSFRDIKKKLKKLPLKAKEKLLTGAVRAGANTVRDEARQKAPVDTGLLKRSIQTVKGKPSLYEVKFFVVTKSKIKLKGIQKSAFYAHMIEFGTIKMAAQPFMRPAFENSDKESIEAAHKYIHKKMDKFTRSL